jgi:hypothetical protein
MVCAVGNNEQRHRCCGVIFRFLQVPSVYMELARWIYTLEPANGKAPAFCSEGLVCSLFDSNACCRLRLKAGNMRLRSRMSFAWRVTAMWHRRQICRVLSCESQVQLVMCGEQPGCSTSKRIDERELFLPARVPPLLAASRHLGGRGLVGD